MRKKVIPQGPNVCPMCTAVVAERIDLKKSDPLPEYDRTDDCANDDYIHIVSQSKLFRVNGPTTKRTPD